MKRIYLLGVFGALTMLTAGCGGSDPASEISLTPANPETPPALGLDAATDAAGESTDAAAPPPIAIDFAAARDAGPDGEAMSDLDLLNEVIERLVMSYEDDGSIPEAGSPAEEAKLTLQREQQRLEQLRAALQSIRDPNDLVRLGLIKSAPKPPAGKQYRMDPKGQFILADAP